MLKGKKRREQEFMDHLKYIQSLLSEKHHIPIKTIESSDGTCIQHGSDGDAYFKWLYQKNILRK